MNSCYMPSAFLFLPSELRRLILEKGMTGSNKEAARFSCSADCFCSGFEFQPKAQFLYSALDLPRAGEGGCFLEEWAHFKSTAC